MRKIFAVACFRSAWRHQFTSAQMAESNKLLGKLILSLPGGTEQCSHQRIPARLRVIHVGGRIAVLQGTMNSLRISIAALRLAQSSKKMTHKPWIVSQAKTGPVGTAGSQPDWMRSD